MRRRSLALGALTPRGGPSSISSEKHGNAFNNKKRRGSTGLLRLKLEEREFLNSINVSLESKKYFASKFSPQKSPLAKATRKKVLEDSENVARTRRSSVSNSPEEGSFELAWRVSDFLCLLFEDEIPDRCKGRFYFGVASESPQQQFDDFCEVARAVLIKAYKDSDPFSENEIRRDVEPLERMKSIVESASRAFEDFEASRYPINRLLQAHGYAVCSFLLYSAKHVNVNAKKRSVACEPMNEEIVVEADQWDSDEDGTLSSSEDSEDAFARSNYLPVEYSAGSQYCDEGQSVKMLEWKVEAERASMELAKRTGNLVLPRRLRALQLGKQFLEMKDVEPAVKNLGNFCSHFASNFSKREGHINSQCVHETLKGELQFHRRRDSIARSKLDDLSRMTGEASETLSTIDHRLAEAKRRSASGPSDMTKQIVKLRKAIRKLRGECRELDLKAEVVRSFLHSTRKSKFRTYHAP